MSFTILDAFRYRSIHCGCLKILKLAELRSFLCHEICDIPTTHENALLGTQQIARYEWFRFVQHFSVQHHDFDSYICDVFLMLEYGKRTPLGLDTYLVSNKVPFSVSTMVGLMNSTKENILRFNILS